MTRFLLVLAVLGFAAVLWRCLGAAIRAVRQGVDHFISREMAETRAQRGDVTGMVEATGWAEEARRGRRRAVAEMVLWALLLALPPWLFSSPVPFYAAYTLVWLLGPGMRTMAVADRRRS
jgi:hypothetical protein